MHGMGRAMVRLIKHWHTWLISNAKFIHFLRYIFFLQLSEIAISKNDHNIEIYKKTSGGYDQTATLSEHGQRVTGIDWEPQHNRIVTSGAVSILPYIHNTILIVKAQYDWPDKLA